MNPGFGGIHPEPIARYLTLSWPVNPNGLGSVGSPRMGTPTGSARWITRATLSIHTASSALVLRYLLEKRGRAARWCERSRRP